jgi:hypothetical protein
VSYAEWRPGSWNSHGLTRGYGVRPVPGRDDKIRQAESVTYSKVILVVVAVREGVVAWRLRELVNGGEHCVEGLLLGRHGGGRGRSANRHRDRRLLGEGKRRERANHAAVVGGRVLLAHVVIVGLEEKVGLGK